MCHVRGREAVHRQLGLRQRGVPQHGKCQPLRAAYGRAVDLVFYPPLTVTIIGDRETADADALRKASLLTYLPSRIVQILDPKYDPILIERSGYEVGDTPRAYLTVGTTEHGVAETPEELLKRMGEIEAERRRGL